MVGISFLQQGRERRRARDKKGLLGHKKSMAKKIGRRANAERETTERLTDCKSEKLLFELGGKYETVEKAEKGKSKKPKNISLNGQPVSGKPSPTEPSMIPAWQSR